MSALSFLEPVGQHRVRHHNAELLASLQSRHPVCYILTLLPVLLTSCKVARVKPRRDVQCSAPKKKQGSPIHLYDYYTHRPELMIVVVGHEVACIKPGRDEQCS